MMRRPKTNRGGAVTRRISRGGRGEGGFTLIELMIVITIILILIGIASGMYVKSVQHAREAALHSDLRTMRDAIENYTMDKQQAPQSLEDLVEGHYLREVPTDPITRQKDWVLHFGDTVLTPEQSMVGLDDVHAGTDQMSSEGTAYSTW
jgi:general secretion pathway protein G